MPRRTQRNFARGLYLPGDAITHGFASLGRRESELRFSVEVRQSEVSPVRLGRHGSSAERSIEKALDRLRLTPKLNGEALGGVPHY